MFKTGRRNYGGLLSNLAGSRGVEKGSGVFSLSLWTTARMHCRFKAKFLTDVDHPVFATERSAYNKTCCDLMIDPLSFPLVEKSPKA